MFSKKEKFVYNNSKLLTGPILPLMELTLLLGFINGNLGPINGNFGAFKKHQIALSIGKFLFFAKNSRRQCLNELHKEYCTKTKLIALD